MSMTDAKGSPLLEESIVTGHLERARHLGLIVVRKQILAVVPPMSNETTCRSPHRWRWFARMAPAGPDSTRRTGKRRVERRHPPLDIISSTGSESRARATVEPERKAMRGSRRRWRFVVESCHSGSRRDVRGQRDRTSGACGPGSGPPPLVCGIRVVVNQADGHRLHAGVLRTGIRRPPMPRQRDQHRSVRACAHARAAGSREARGAQGAHEQIRLLEAMLVGHLPGCRASPRCR